MSDCQAGEPEADDVQLYRLFQASEILKCNVWELAEQSEFWVDAAFWYAGIRAQVRDGLEEIAEQRAQHAEKEFSG